jgi:hypothetical protein
MAAVTVLRRATNKAHPTSVLEADTILVGGVELSAAGPGNLFADANVNQINLGTGGTAPIDIGSTGGGAVTLNSGGTIAIGDGSAGAVSVDSNAGVSVDAGAASNFTTSVGALTLTSAAAATWSAAAGDLTLQATTNSVIVTGAEAAADAVQLTASNAAGGVDINAGGTSGTVTIDGGGACTITTAGINLAAGSSEIDLTTTGALDLNSGAYTLNCSTAVVTPTSTYDLEATGAIGIDSSAAINIGDTNATAVQVGRAGISVTIPGDLVVQGTTTSVDNENMQTQDNHIYLNKDYTTVSGQTGGLALNYLPTATTDTEAAGGFTAATTVATTGASGLATGGGAFVQVSGAANPANDGIYEVATHTGNVLTINGSPTHRFCNTAFTVDATGSSATFTIVNISVIQSNTTGDWQLGKADDATALTSSLSTIGAGAGNSLDAAYQVGATITTTGGDGNVIIAGTEALQVTATGGLDVDTLIDFDGSTLDAVASGAISLDAGAASNFSVSGAGIDLTLASAAGRVVMDGGEAAADAVVITASNAAGGIDIDAGATSGTVAINSGGSTTITSAGINLAGGASEIDLTTTGAVDINSAAGTWDSSSTLDFEAATSGSFNVTTGTLTLSTTTSGDLTLSTTTAGDILLSGAAEIDISATTLVDINGASLEADLTGAFSIDGATASNITVSGATADLTLGARAATITLNETGDTTLDGGFTATSIVGALNELLAGGGAETAIQRTVVTTNRAVGEPVIMDGDGSADTATDASAIATAEGFIGIVTVAAAAGTVVTAGTVNAQVIAGLVVASYAAGAPVYLSLTTGRVTMDVSAFSPPNDVVYQIGIATDASNLTVTTTVDGDLLEIELRPFVPVEL